MTIDDNNTKDGFTLVEFLIYIAILTIMMIGLGGIVWNVMGGGAQVSALEEISSNARFALNKMTYEVRKAESINSPAPGATSTSLSLGMADSEKNPTVFDLDLAGSTLRIKQGAGDSTNITSNAIAVSDLEFKNVSYPDTRGTIFVSFTLSFRGPVGLGKYDVERRFQTTINLLPK